MNFFLRGGFNNLPKNWSNLGMGQYESNLGDISQNWGGEKNQELRKE